MNFAADRGNMTSEKSISAESCDGAERRRRSRLACRVPGWLIPNHDATPEPWEVRMRDLSRLGVGFDSGVPLASGEVLRIRVGHGPMKLARPIRIVNCFEQHDRSYAIGGEFCQT